MNKKISSEIAIIIVLLIAGFFGYVFWKENQVEDIPNKGVQNINQKISFESIDEVRNYGKNLNCEVVYAENVKVSIDTYDDKFYIKSPEADGSVIKELYDGDKLYIWDELKKKGFYQDRKCLNLDTDSSLASLRADVQGQLRISCELSLEPQSSFIAPAGVDFIDACKKFKEEENVR